MKSPKVCFHFHINIISDLSWELFVLLLTFPSDLEWKLTYVGSAESTAYDQILDTVVVGPVPVGKHKVFFFSFSPLIDCIVLG